MISALVVLAPSVDNPPLVEDLTDAGLQVLGSTDCGNLVRDALQRSPDVLVIWDPQPDEALFRAIETLTQAAALPVLLFTLDARAETLERALRAGVHGWVVQGYAASRLRPLVQLAQARFRQGHAAQATLTQLSDRFEERKLVDRAKGILMRASQMSEDDAFRTLRTASMHGNRRVGQVSQQVIDAALYADAINRAGQLRMLSQRGVKLYALAVASASSGASGSADAAGARALLVSSLDKVQANLAALDKLLSRPTFGDLLDDLRTGWDALRSLLTSTLAHAPTQAQQQVQLQAVDQAAEHVLAGADRLVGALEAAGLAGTLRVINLCGRQRMLSQRLAKLALLSDLLQGELATRAEAEVRQIAAEFEQATQTLRGLPIATREIHEALDTAARTWSGMLAAVRQVATPEGRRALAATSEALLELFERLTERYERSMQVLIG